MTGTTVAPVKRSVKASDAMYRLDSVFSGRCMAVAKMTKRLAVIMNAEASTVLARSRYHSHGEREKSPTEKIICDQKNG